jgi:cytochrome b6-f complex iron-sulfur subunit
MTEPNANASGSEGSQPASQPGNSESITPKPTAPPPPTAITPTPAPPKPAAPKPAPAGAKPQAAKAGGSRRAFISAMTWINVGWATMSAAVLGMLLGTVRFLFPNVSSEPPSKVRAGPPGQYEEGKVVERFKEQNFWIVRYQGVIYALSTTCTHLGCTPNWLEREEKFKCPCHGSGFKITGINFEGPAPRPLERWGVSVGEDGDVIVDKSKKFQWERGEWDNPESFIVA